MTHRRTDIVVLGIALVAVLCDVVAFAKESDRPAKRARPPKWPADVLDVFFEDARETLVGPRPDYSEATAVAASGGQPNEGTASATAAPTGAGWSKLIDAETLETEIKRLGQAVTNDVTTPSEFKGGAYEDCRRHFSVLAVLFGIAAEYDGDVRWQDSAPALRDLFTRAGHNCKVGTDQTFKEATQRKQDLVDLIGGSRPKLPPAERTAEWSEVADRPPLMQRLNIAHEDRLTKWLANKRQFEQHRDDVRHEAQLAAAIADVIGREGFDYWDEEEYAKHARELHQAASDMSAAVELDNYEQAQKAISRATKSCADCHDLYRG